MRKFKKDNEGDALFSKVAFSTALCRLQNLAKLSSLKSALDSYRPFSVHVVKQLRDYYRIGLTYTSNAIEGNTLTESETTTFIFYDNRNYATKLKAGLLDI